MFTLIEIGLSVAVLVTLLTVLSACVCGCKNSNQKSELVGTAGVVKLRFDEEAPSPTPTTPASVKRASTQNSHRSLPEIPHPMGRHDSADTTSEIYATVNLDQGDKAVAAASTSREHPYEHAYAKLQNENHIIVEITPDQRAEGDLPIDEREVSQSNPESVVISASVAISGQLPSSQELPYITPPPLDHNGQHFSGDSTDSAKGYTSISVREPLSNIRAQSAAAPPPPPPPPGYGSDDSDEMYAAIEDGSAAAGSATYAQIAQPRAAPGPAADSAARRSAPPEMGTSVATHSRQASSSSCTNSTGALGSPKPEKRQANSPLPPPPRGGPPAAPGASAGPAAPTAPPGAPVEARGRSPAPPGVHGKQQRISSTGDLVPSAAAAAAAAAAAGGARRAGGPRHARNNSCVSSSDFYGCNYPDPHRYSSGPLAPAAALAPAPAPATTPADRSLEPSDYSTDTNNSLNSQDQRLDESPGRNLEEMYAKVLKKRSKEEPNRRSKDFTDSAPKFRGDDPGYETIDRKKSSHGYETITHKERKTSQNQDPGYETVKDIHKTTNHFLNNNLLNNVNIVCNDSGPNSIISSSDGYEHINKIENSASDSDPNYEVLRTAPPAPPYALAAACSQPTYSTVNKNPGKYDWTPNNNDEGPLEPNYESMPNEAREPLYTTGSESDPNYESVHPKDPNYETVSGLDPNYESLRLRDPKYESVRSKASTKSKDPNYESVKYFDLTKDPPYEKVRNDDDSVSGVERSDSNAGYERINVANNIQAKSSINNGADTVSDYFQV